jgi:glycosyltransferase involved in cell wall biosynthesis
VWGTTFDKNRLLGRAANLMSFSLSALWTLARHLRRGDVVLVLTNPPTLPIVVAWACWLRGARYAVLIHDLYPDTLVAVAGLTETAIVVRAWRALNRRLFAGAARIIVVGRDMRARVGRHHPEHRSRIVVIPNWGETGSVTPTPRDENALLRSHGLLNHFVVLYAGNLGRPNDVATIAEAARRLRDDPALQFVVVGGGAREPWLRQFVAEHELTNVRLLGPRPRDEQIEFLNACDVAVVPFVRGMQGVAVPGRLYNLLAAGKPIIAIVEAGSEVALVVGEGAVGWVTTPHDVDGFVAALTAARADRATLAAMSQRARRIAETEYSGETALAQYAAEMRALIAADAP